MNNILKKYHLHSGFIALIGLMLATRVHHFGSAFSLPDASLAVFFFAGMYCNRAGFFALLLGLAAFIDYAAISHFGVSDFCVSKAYIALVPTYGVMWLAGHYSQTLTQTSAIELTRQCGLLIAAITFAFLISNGSFYLFSGRYPEPSLAVYLERAALYYPPYLIAPLMYSAVIFAGLKLIAALKASANTADQAL